MNLMQLAKNLFKQLSAHWQQPETRARWNKYLASAPELQAPQQNTTPEK